MEGRERKGEMRGGGVERKGNGGRGRGSTMTLITLTTGEGEAAEDGGTFLHEHLPEAGVGPHAEGYHSGPQHATGFTAGH